MTNGLLTVLLIGVLGFALGTVLTLALGDAALAVIIPGIGIATTWVVGRSRLPRRLQPLVPAIAVQGGHLLWLVQGVLVLRYWDALFLDAIPLAAGLIWLTRRPERKAVVFLLAVHAAGIVLPLARLNRTSAAGDAVFWLGLHILLRLTGSYLTLVGWRRLWQRGERYVR